MDSYYATHTSNQFNNVLNNAFSNIFRTDNIIIDTLLLSLIPIIVLWLTQNFKKYYNNIKNHY